MQTKCMVKQRSLKVSSNISLSPWMAWIDRKLHQTLWWYSQKIKPHRPLRKTKVLHACNYIVNCCLYWKIKPFERADSQQIWGLITTSEEQSNAGEKMWIIPKRVPIRDFRSYCFLLADYESAFTQTDTHTQMFTLLSKRTYSTVLLYTQT